VPPARRRANRLRQEADTASGVGPWRSGHTAVAGVGSRRGAPRYQASKQS